MNRIALGLAAGAMLVTAACAGEGTGLDEFGRPAGERPPLGASLSAIQANVFTPICTQCHTGTAAPHGLALDAGLAWNNLVNTPSVEQPALMRVRPGVPDSSYIIWKIEGRTGIVGGRMPLGLQPLAPEVIAAIRAWIENGAARN